MKSLTTKFFVAGCITAAICLATSNVTGQDAAKDAAKRAALNTSMTKTRLALAGVSGDTLDKAMKIAEEHAPKIAEAMAKQQAILTPEQRQILGKATREAAMGVKDGTKKLDDISADAAAALKSLNMSTAQKASYDAARQAVLDATKAQNEALRPLLTREQQIKMEILPLPKTK
jgi:hypothetical protein